MNRRSEPQEPIVVAELVNPGERFSDVSLPSSQKRSCLIPILIVSGVLLMLIVAIGVILWSLLGPPKLDNLTTIERGKAMDQRYADAHAAFVGEFSPENDPDFNAINQLITRVSSIVDNQNNSGLEQVLDFDRNAEEMRRNPELGGLRFVGNKLLGGMNHQRILGPSPFSKFQIFKIQQLRENERLVYLQTSDGYSSVTPYLWWIVKRNRTWRLYDWHQLEYENRETREVACLWGDSNEATIAAYRQYAELSQEYFEFPGTQYDNDRGRPEPEILCEMERLQLPDVLVSNVHYDIALRWHQAQNPVDALRVLDKISNPETCPGAIRLRATIYADQGREAESIELYNQYIDRVGPDALVLSRLASCYRKLGQFDQELACLHRVVRYRTVENVSDSIRIMSIDSPDGIAAHFEQVDKRTDSDAVYRQLLNSIGADVFFTSEMDQLRRHLATKYPDSEVLLLAESQLAFASGTPAEGLRLLKLSLEKSSENDQSSFWSIAIYHNQVAEAVRCSDDIDQALQQLLEIHEWGDDEFELDELSELLVERLETEPENGIANFVAGRIALDNSKHADAIRHFEVASRNLTEVSDEDEMDLQSDSRSLLAEAYLCQGNLEPAIKIATEENCLESLLEIAIAEQHVENLNRLLEVFDADSRFQPYYKGQVLALEKKFGLAKHQLIRFLRQPTEDHDEFSYHEWRAVQKFVEVCAEEGDIILAFEMVPTEGVFSTIAEKLVRDRQWDQAVILLEKGKKLGRPGQDSTILDRCQSLEFDLLWHQQKYAELIKHYRSHNETTNVESAQIGPVDLLERIVRASFYIEDHEMARKAAEKLANKHFEFKMQGLIALRENRIDDFIKIRNRQSEYERDDYLTDPDAPPLSTQDMRRIIGDQPRSLDVVWANANRVQWLSKNPTLLDTSKIEKAIQKILGTHEPVTKIAYSPSGRNSWICRSGTYVVTVSSGVSKCQISQISVDPEFRELFDQHQSSTIVTMHSSAFDDGEPLMEHVIKISQQLIEDDCLVVGVDFAWETWQDVRVLWDRVLAGKLATSELANELKYIYMDESSGESPRSRAFKERSEFNRSLYAASRNWLRDPLPKPATRLKLTATFSFHDATELVDIDVSSIDRAGYDQVRFVGRLENNSELDQRFQAGDRVTVNLEQIVSWELQENGETKRGEFQQ